MNTNTTSLESRISPAQQPASFILQFRHQTMFKAVCGEKSLFTLLGQFLEMVEIILIVLLTVLVYAVWLVIV